MLPYATAQNNLSSGDQQTLRQFWVNGKILSVHVIPSGLVAAVLLPYATAQNNLNSGDQQTPCQFFKDDMGTSFHLAVIFHTIGNTLEGFMAVVELLPANASV